MRRMPLDRNDYPLPPAASPLRAGLLRPAMSPHARLLTPSPAAEGAHEDDQARAPLYPRAPDVIDMDSELGYWRGHYRGLPGGSALRYGDYEPAVKLGLDAYMRSRGRAIDDMEDELEACYRRTRGPSRLDWAQARAVVRLAWNHLHLRGLKE